MQILILVKVGKEYRKVSLGETGRGIEGLNHIETNGFEMAFINGYSDTVTYVLDKRNKVEFEFDQLNQKWYNIIIS